MIKQSIESINVLIIENEWTFELSSNKLCFCIDYLPTS